jgi:hypothetical protein
MRNSLGSHVKWGHGVEAVETLPRSFAAVLRNKLQWSHGFEAVDEDGLRRFCSANGGSLADGRPSRLRLPLCESQDGRVVLDACQSVGEQASDNQQNHDDTQADAPLPGSEMGEAPDHAKPSVPTARNECVVIIGELEGCGQGRSP